MKFFHTKEEAKKFIQKNIHTEKFLCKAELIGDSYEIEMTEENNEINYDQNDLNFNEIDIDNIPWIISKYVFENNRENGYKIHIGDIFKLGKYILKVKEIGNDEEDKKIIFDRKNTQKNIRNKNINNNSSQMPLNLNQEENDYSKILNINIHHNSHKKRESSHNENNIRIIDNENEESKSDENSNKINSIVDSSKISSNNIGNNNNNLNFASVVNVNQENFNDISDKNINNNIISIYYRNKNLSNESNNISINNNNNININNITGKNKNLYFINIIKNNSASNDSKNKINNSNSFNINSFGYNTFNKDSLKNSSLINKSNFQSLKYNDTGEENENIKKTSQKFLTIIKPPTSKNSTKELKSTASFNKKKVLDIIQKKILTNTEKSSKPLCRICLSEEHIKDNPLIHPCNCDGTMKYIHLQCLRLLIQSKIKKTENDSCKILTFKKLECEICKMAFPEKISIKGSLYSIIEIEKPDKDYLVLEGLIKEIPEEKSIFIVHFKNKKEIKIGRATDANIRLNDISVSRAHATINQYNGNFYLHDTNAKFGTLIKMKNKFNILLNKPFFIQKGNTFFEFMMKKTFWAYFKCYKQKNDFYMNYNECFDDILYSKYPYQKKDDILINEKTKSVSEYSSEVIKYNNKIDIKSIKSFNKYANNLNINENNNTKDNNPTVEFESFRYNKSKRKNSLINKTQENSNQLYKSDMTKSKIKEGLSIEGQENDNSLSLNHVLK